MPAVNPARLQIFELYANRTLRIGEPISSQPLIPMYHLPDLVTRQVELELRPHIHEDPLLAIAIADDLWTDAFFDHEDSLSAIAIADDLWTDAFFEIQHLAGFILGLIITDDPEPICTRLENWLTPDLDKTLASDLLSYGTRSIQSAFPVVWEQFIESYLTHKDPKMVALGLQGVRARLGVHSDKLLPSVFRLISPLIRDVDQDLSKELEHLIKALVSVSPTETTFYLKQAVSVSESKGTARLVKQCLPFFDDELKQELNDSLS